ncbi:DUF6281 family protein [Streptomyces lomondensis]|uniref:Lipoprotein n=1 Tax=Streptomyces lomondensis TaxID=68229 RepID=A0ABQ2XIF4_9ACTN|nr:DUF6281 family protein [Streptomyces lomondensis]MCF0082757.1 DUF6281 family protein [Streptomyces lomondensis]GGX18090.1 hypothetical protein GCM10010383_55060 [Streptomyces lomondensis]
MSWAKRSMSALLTAVAVTSGAACTSDHNSAEDSASCVYQVTYEGRTYRDVANVEFTVADKLGAATKPPCDDTGGQGEGEEPATTTETAYAVDGISPKVAIAVGDTPGDVTFVAAYSGNELPTEVKKLIANP